MVLTKLLFFGRALLALPPLFFFPLLAFWEPIGRVVLIKLHWGALFCLGIVTLVGSLYIFSRLSPVVLLGLTYSFLSLLWAALSG